MIKNITLILKAVEIISLFDLNLYFRLLKLATNSNEKLLKTSQI
jgi:hypothetical protein